jgi:folate-dependent phosphoribosylglycinamide formyltransferase PurN
MSQEQRPEAKVSTVAKVSAPSLSVVVLTRTGRLSGARFAGTVAAGPHRLCGIMTERRSAMLLRTIRRLGLRGFLRKYPPAMLLSRLRETLAPCAATPGNEHLSAREIARRHGALYAEEADMNSARAAETLRLWKPDILLVANAPVLKPHVIATARLGGINFHSGRLPEYGGVASEFWALFDGRTEAWVTLHSVSDALDSGEILSEAPIPVRPDDTPDSLHERCLEKGVSLIGP